MADSDRIRVFHGASRRRFLGLGAGMMAASALFKLTGCGSSQPLMFGSHVWPGYEFLFLADRQGWLKEHGVRLLETRSATESLEALAQGRIHAATLTLDEVMQGRSLGIPLSVVLLFDISAGADAVLAKSRLESLGALRGLRIGVETSAVGSLVLQKTLAMAGLKRADVKVVPVTVNEHISTWAADEVDVLITYEPTASKLESAGAIRILDSRHFPDTIFDTLAVNGDTIADHGEQIRSLIRSHFQGLRSWQQNPIEHAIGMAAHLGVEPDRVATLYRGLELPDVEFNRHLLTPPAQELHQAVTAIRDAALDTTKEPEALSAPLFTPDYLPSVDL